MALTTEQRRKIVEGAYKLAEAGKPLFKPKAKQAQKPVPVDEAALFDKIAMLQGRRGG